jgi:hypothetical protein
MTLDPQVRSLEEYLDIIMIWIGVANEKERFSMIINNGCKSKIKIV